MSREFLKDRKRIVVKIGSSSLTHPETGNLNFHKIEQLVRCLTDMRNSGKDVILVTSGAIAVGRQTMNIKPQTLSEKQALASVGQARLMMTYQRMFSEYNQVAGQILMTKTTIVDNLSRKLARNTIEQLLEMGVIPVVNENDTLSTYEIQFGDNDRLSAIVTALVEGDLLILLSDIDGLYTDDPHNNPDATLIREVEHLDSTVFSMGKSSSSSNVGTGGMDAKLHAAMIATCSGADMIIMNGNDLNRLTEVLSGEEVGTLFYSNRKKNFDILDVLSE